MNNPVLYCGDPHGRFEQIIRAAQAFPGAPVVLLGDMEPSIPLGLALAPIRSRVWWIAGNHDSDSQVNWERVWEGGMSDRNADGRVVSLPNGRRLAGLAGVFRQYVWYPRAGAASEAPRFRNRAELAKKTPRQDRLKGGPHLKHWSSIYPDEFEHLAQQRADVLVTHEAPGYHPFGFPVLDELARSLGARVVVHGHQHDSIDSSARWAEQGFRSFGVGLRGVTAIDVDGEAQVIVAGESGGAGAGGNA